MFKVITKEEYLNRACTTAIAANPSKGIMSNTYVLLEGEAWANFSGVLPFVQGYWAGIKEMETKAEEERQFNKRVRHAFNYGMGPERFSESGLADMAPEEPKQEKEEKKGILEERQRTHGDFQNVAHISQELKRYLREQPSWESLTDVQREAWDNIAQKTARVFAGNPNFPAHWIDIQGYAKLAQQEIEKNGRSNHS